MGQDIPNLAVLLSFFSFLVQSWCWLAGGLEQPISPLRASFILSE